MHKLILLLVILIPELTVAQETVEREHNWVFLTDDRGMVIGRVNPTPQFALDAVRAQQEWRHRAALAVLRQTIQPRSASKLDEFADELGKLAIEGSHWSGPGEDALYILKNATSVNSENGEINRCPGCRLLDNSYHGTIVNPEVGGIPYERGLDVLIEVYEKTKNREFFSTERFLSNFLLPAGGTDYLVHLFESLDRPVKSCWMPPPYRIAPNGEEPERGPEPPKEEWCPYETEWCQVSTLLIRKNVAGVDPALVYSLCDRSKVDDDWAFEKEIDGVFIFHKDNGQSIQKVTPTPQFALKAIQAENYWGDNAAVIILRQRVESRSDAALDTFAMDLRKLVLESPSELVAGYALDALGEAANKSTYKEGIPYEQGLDLLIELYEAMSSIETIRAKDVLRVIFHAGGEDYVRNLFESSEPPEKPCTLEPQVLIWQTHGSLPKEDLCPYQTPWCAAGEVLAWKDEIDPTLIYPTCSKEGLIYENGGWVLIRY